MLDLDPDPGDKNNVDPCESGLALDYALLKTYQICSSKKIMPRKFKPLSHVGTYLHINLNF